MNTKLLQPILWLGWLLWMLSFVQLIKLGQKVKKTKMASQILNDERVELNRLKTWRIAFIAVLLTQVVIIILSFVSLEPSGILSAEISIFIAVVSAISAFIYYDKQTAYD